MERIVWIDRFPIRVGIGSNGPWVAAAIQEKTPYGASASALAEALNATDENRADHLRKLRSGEGFFLEGASVMPLLSWGPDRTLKVRRACKGYFDHVSEDELWLCQSFDEDDFVALPYGTLIAIVNTTISFKERGELPPGV